MTNLKNNFFVKAWKGEERFWKVFLVVLTGLGLLFLLNFIWVAILPKILFISVGLFLITILFKNRKNLESYKIRSINLFVNVLLIMTVIIYLFWAIGSLLSIVIGTAGCQPTGSFCESFI